MKKIFIILTIFLLPSYWVTNFSPSLAQTYPNPNPPTPNPVATSGNPQSFGGQAVLGQVTQVVNKTISLVENDGSKIDLTTTEVTKFVRAGRRILLSDVSPGDKVVAVGALSTVDNTFLVKTLIVKPVVLKQLIKIGVYGQVTKIGDTSFTITNAQLANPLGINVTSQTAFSKGGRKTTFDKLTTAEVIVAVVIKETNGDLTGRLVTLLELPITSPRPATPAAQIPGGY